MSVSRREAGHGAMLAALLALSAVALAVRLYAAERVGFGDSEALYASYAFYPRPAYVDHPGLIGLVAGFIGGGGAPSPLAAHTLSAIAATLAPWAALLAARALGGNPRASVGAAFAVAAAPEVAVGLFGMTPDLPLFFAWLAVLALLGRALLARPGGAAAAALFVSAGLSLGVACVAKVSGLTLAVALLVALGSPEGRKHARTPWPWVALALAAVIFSPVLAFESRTGWPMLRHRLIDTQLDAGLSLRNAAAVVLGQAAYISPALFVTGLWLGRDLVHARRTDVVHALLAAATVVPLFVLGVLCLWSRVAEPHWLAPVWLPLPLYYALRPGRVAPPSRPEPPRETGPLSRRTRVAGVVVGLAASAGVYAWVLCPELVARVPPALYDPRLDIANELYGWPDVAEDVARTVLDARPPLSEPGDVVVVGPVWMVAAQLRAALPRDIPVGCAGTSSADFDDWLPPRVWSRAELLVLVHDNRAPVDSARLFPDRRRVEQHTRTVTRGGKVARVFTVEVLSRRAAG